MFRVHCQLPRSEAERLSDLLASLDPSPVSAVSVEEVSKVSWSLDAFCADEPLAVETAEIISREAPGARTSVQKLDDKDWVAESLAGLPAVHAGPFVVAGAHELAKVGPAERFRCGSRPAPPSAPAITARPRAASRPSRSN